VNETMCCGCPVVASDRVGAARDLVAAVAPQFVFPCRDVDALAKILADVAADRARLQSVARAPLTHIQTRSPERNIAAAVEAIRIGVERPGRAPAFSPQSGSRNHAGDTAAAIRRRP
jgi:glycosyltransferase involved in cell wall biosynthesis